MAKEKSEKIPAVSDDPAVIAAQKKLTELEQKLERAINRPSQAIMDNIRERAQALLNGTKMESKREPDEVQVLREAVQISLGVYQQAQAAAAKKIIESIRPLHNKTTSELLDISEKFSESLLSQASFIENCWRSDLYDFLPAEWSLKWRIVLTGKPGVGSRLDSLIQNLRASLD